jgi:L-type amino acid transporter 9
MQGKCKSNVITHVCCIERGDSEYNVSFTLHAKMAEKSVNNGTDDTTKDRLMSSNGDTGGAQMKRDVGLIGGVAVIVGTMIGSGIFASPKYVLMFSGSVGMALVIWTLCGILAMCGALSYAELGTMIPTSGGESTYLLEAFGGLPSFMYIWTACIVIKPSQIAIVCLVFGEYVVTPFFPDCAGDPDVQVIIKLLAAFAIGKCSCVSFMISSDPAVLFTADITTTMTTEILCLMSCSKTF